MFLVQLPNVTQLTGELFTEKKLGNVEVIRHILKTEGINGMRRGLGITVSRELVSSGFYFATLVQATT